MISCSIVFLVNYPNPKEQKSRIKAHAPVALKVTAVLLVTGVIVDILGNSGMLETLTIPLLKIIPGFIATKLNILTGLLFRNGLRLALN